MSEPYQPVSCQLHSELELIIMHKQSIKLRQHCCNTISEDIVTPYDIVSRAGEGEFLLAFNQSQEQLQFRLDQLIDFKIIPNK